MNPRTRARLALASALIATTLLLDPAGARADTVVNYSVGVTSGSSSYHNTNAVCSHGPGSEMSFRQTSSNPNAVGRYKLWNVSSETWSSVREVNDNGVGSWTAGGNASHRLYVRRAVPTDTNGAFVPGSGVTTFSGRFRCT